MENAYVENEMLHYQGILLTLGTYIFYLFQTLYILIFQNLNRYKPHTLNSNSKHTFLNFTQKKRGQIQTKVDHGKL